jgi:hypothetical protein
MRAGLAEAERPPGSTQRLPDSKNQALTTTAVLAASMPTNPLLMTRRVLVLPPSRSSGSSRRY